MDLQFWIYLIIAIIYIVSRAMKNTGKQAEEPQHQRPSSRPASEAPARTAEKPRPLTFEELLREITEGKQPGPPVYEPARPEAEYTETEVVDYDDQIGEEAQDLEEAGKRNTAREKMYDTYEEAKRMAFERPSLEETMRLSDTKVQFEKFRAFETKKERDLLGEYTRDFSDVNGLKKAVVMAEILNRKFEY